MTGVEFRELWFNLQQRDQLEVSHLVQESRVVGISKQGFHAKVSLQCIGVIVWGSYTL